MGWAFLAPPFLVYLTLDVTTLPALVVAQLGLWAIMATLLAVVLRLESRPLQSIGWTRPRWRSLGIGGLAAVVLLHVVSPVAAGFVAAVAGDGLSDGMDRLMGRPVAYMAFAALTAGVVEETLFRGFVLQRLEEWTNSTPLAVLVGVTAFSLVHLPFWGIAGAMFTFFGGLFFAVLFVATRDLWACGVAHATTAFAQLLPLAH